MDYKKDMLKLLNELKSKNHSRRRIEEYLGYAPKTLDQLLSKGGNESIIIKLKAYKSEVEKGNIGAFENVMNEPEVKMILEVNPFRDKKGSEWKILQLLCQEIAADRARLQNKNANECLLELYTKVGSILQVGKDG